MMSVSDRVRKLLEERDAVVVVIDGLYVATPHRPGIRVTADTGPYGDASGDVVVRLRRQAGGYALTDYYVQRAPLFAALLDAAEMGWDTTDEDHDGLLRELEASFAVD